MRTFLIASVSILALSATAAMGDEEGKIIQGGNLGAAYIEQDVEMGFAFIEQGAGSDEDVAAISQLEAGTYGSSATITQNTVGAGYGNIAGILQTNLDSGSTVGEINQDGSGNTAGIRQRDAGNMAMIDQDGDDNRAMIKQGDVPPGFSELEADSGNLTTDTDFSAELNFAGTSGGIFAGGNNGPAQYSTAGVAQSGNDNEGAVLQLGYNHFGNVMQDGDDNKATVMQTGELNTSMVEQYGSFNDAIVLQTGVNNLADVMQDGNDNYAGVVQLDDAGDTAMIYQTGEGHVGLVYQSADGIMSMGTINQSGYGNSAMITQ